ncbi:PAS domain-containing protein [Rudanella paleaurantiibacter]|nr:PAS domain-containing protein [Rudanella paleaurantiibacter]
MNVSESYVEMLNRSFRPSQQEGCRPFPIASLEITLLDEAQQRAKEREKVLFARLCRIFDWKLTRQQRRYYAQSLQDGMTLVLTDLSKSILWTSHSFLTLTGYTMGEVLGRTPSLLQGKDTNMSLMRKVGDQLRHARPVNITTRNHRKNGESYLCRIMINPMRNTQGDLTHFLAVEYEVADA